MILGFEHSVQLSVFFKAVGAGYIIGLFFSVVMFLNALAGKSSLRVFVRDVAFFVFSALFSFLFILKYNSGIVRFYILAGELIGFCLFYILPGKSSAGLWKKLFARCDIIKNRISLRLEKKKQIREEKSKKKKQKKSEKKETAIIQPRKRFSCAIFTDLTKKIIKIFKTT